MVATCGDGCVDKYTLTSLLQCYCNAGRPDGANGVFQRMSQRGWVDEHVLTMLAVAFSKWGKVDGAVELLGRMEALGMRPSEKTLSVLVHGFVKQRRVDKAMEMFDKIATSGFVANFSLYCVLIEGLCTDKEIGKAVKLFEQMKNSEVAPDVRLLKKMVEAFCHEGDFAIVGPFINENAAQLKPSDVIALYNVVLEGLVNHGQVEAAYQLLTSMLCGVHEISEGSAVGAHVIDTGQDVKPNSDSFNIVVCGLCKVKKLDDALALIKDMIGFGCKGKLLMFNDLIYELCSLDRRNDPNGALDLLREMRTNGHKPWIKNCTEMVQQLCFSGRITEALGFLEEMLKMGFLPDIVTYSAAMNGLCKAGEVDNALGLFRGISAKYYLPDVVGNGGNRPLPLNPNGNREPENAEGINRIRYEINFNNDEWERVREAVRGTNPLPIDAPRDMLMGYYWLLVEEHNRQIKQQHELEQRRQAVDESSMRRAALSSAGGSSSKGNNGCKYNSRMERMDPATRREATKALDMSFMMMDSQGNMMPKMPHATVMAAPTYLTSK
uniref:Uncharacterized protein n=1 Tax=Avena sativa TaxID=4498 RepID=A0ACD6ANX2_AVESA